MTNRDMWLLIKPGERVDLPRRAVIKLADQPHHHHNITHWNCVEIGGNGNILDVHDLIDLDRLYVGEFVVP